jgi:hypothetical protein
MTTHILSPVKVQLLIKDCMDCPCVDADCDYTVCMMKDGPKLPICRQADQVILPPKGCPLRQFEGKILDASELRY